MDFTNRINLCINGYYGGNKKRFALACKLPYSTVNDYTLGKRKDPPISLILTMHNNLPQINLYWLAFGIGEASTNAYNAADVNEDALSHNLRPLFNAELYRNCDTDSMEPLIKRGDRLAVKKVKFENIVFGRVYLVELGSENVLTQLAQTEDAEVLQARNLNTNYPMFTIAKKQITALYLVVGITGKR